MRTGDLSTSLATLGRCEGCPEPVDPERLAADSLAGYCLNRLTPREQRALEQDLDLAWSIQSSLLPRPQLRTDEWEASYHYEPAGPASGDCCDLLPLENRELFFLVGDVMGKGLAASMLMAYLQAIFRSLAGVPASLTEVAERANRVFAQSTGGVRYATLVFGRLRSSGEAELVNAGHCPPILLRNGRASTIAPTGLPLGLFTAVEYSSSSVRLAPGDSLVLYTDGVTESRDPAGEEYGAERLEVAALGHEHRPGREILDACLTDLKTFRRGTHTKDDQTLLILKRVVAGQ